MWQQIKAKKIELVVSYELATGATEQNTKFKSNYYLVQGNCKQKQQLLHRLIKGFYEYFNYEILSDFKLFE
ncbi:hypothetical protein pb186bvf_015288 [Paramecium bursaria]